MALARQAGSGSARDATPFAIEGPKNSLKTAVVQPLVIFHKQLGDTLLLEPALAKLAAFHGEPVRLSTRASFLAMVDLMDGVVAEASVGMGRASRVISFSANGRAGFKTFLTSAPEKRLVVENEGRLRWWHRFVYRSGREVRPIGDQYRARHYFDAMPCAETVPFRPPRLRLPDPEWRHPQLPERYLLLHPTAAWRSKAWPAEHWVEVLDALHDSGYGPFVVTGGVEPWERQFAAGICESSRARTLNLAGLTSLKSYLYTVAHAQGVLCVDGSSSHLSAAFGRPCLTLFGSSSAIHWHWKTERAVALVPPEDVRKNKGSVRCIPVSEVLQAALSLLGPGTPKLGSALDAF